MSVTVEHQKTTYLEDVLTRLGWTIDRLARKAEMSYSQTHNIVTKGVRPGTRIGNIEKISDALGVSVVDVLDKQVRQE